MVKIFRTLITWENDRTPNKAIISLEMTMQAAEDWELHSIQYAGQQQDKPELHRYVTVYYKEVNTMGAMKYVIEEILNEDFSDFEDLGPEEIVNYIEKRYDEKLDENIAEAHTPNEKPES